MKFKKHPVSGEPLSLKDVIKLHFHKNSDGEYMCPVLNKVFTEHTHIVAIRPSGNVYCWEVGLPLSSDTLCDVQSLHSLHVLCMTWWLRLPVMYSWTSLALACRPWRSSM